MQIANVLIVHLRSQLISRQSYFTHIIKCEITTMQSSAPPTLALLLFALLNLCQGVQIEVVAFLLQGAGGNGGGDAAAGFAAMATVAKAAWLLFEDGGKARIPVGKIFAAYIYRTEITETGSIHQLPAVGQRDQGGYAGDVATVVIIAEPAYRGPRSRLEGLPEHVR